MKLYIPLILGTAREGRHSEKVAKFVLELMKSDDRIETELIDVKDYPSANTARVSKEKFDDKGLVKKIEKASGYIIIAPEYNHGYPGELKIFLDHYYNEFNRKVFGICSVSGGPWGGQRMVESLRLVLGAFNAVVPKQTVPFPGVVDAFDDQGKISPDLEERAKKSVTGMLDEVVWYASALKIAREAS